MITKEQIITNLEMVPAPVSMRSIVGLNLVKDINISGDKVNIKLASTGLAPGAQEWIENKVEKSIKELPEVKEVTVEYSDANAKDLNQIKHIIAVMSGKGGVGKSLVSGLAAIALNRKGFSVGILDADITGASIPKMFNLKDMPSGNESGILPLLSRSGIEVMSVNLLIPNEDDAVIWRGPMIGNTIKQFGEDVLWGKLDYLIIDLPPGTADAPLTVMQSFPLTGVIIVFTPQDLVEMIVRKAVNMARKMEKPVLGVVENMSYLHVPELKKNIEVFGRSRGEELAHIANAPLLARLPIDPELVKLCDAGDIERYDNETVNKFGESLLTVIPSVTG